MRRTHSRIAFRLWLAIVLVGLMLPLLSMIALSFNASRFGTFPFSFSTHWYSALGSDEALLEALWESIILASEVAAVALVLGTLLSLGLWRASVLIKVPISGLLVALLSIPALILAACLVSAVEWLGISNTHLALVLGCTVISLPFVVLIELARLANLGDEYLDAARSLGAGPIRRFFTVTVPLMAPAILTGGMLAFVFCFNNFALQLFLSPIGVNTLPVEIYSSVRLGVTPDINALGTLIVVGAVLVIVSLNWMSGSAARVFTNKSAEEL